MGVLKDAFPNETRKLYYNRYGTSEAYEMKAMYTKEVDDAIKNPKEYFRNNNKFPQCVYLTDIALEYIESKYPDSGLENMYLVASTKDTVNNASLIIKYIYLYKEFPSISILSQYGFDRMIKNILSYEISNNDITSLKRCIKNKEGKTPEEILELPGYLIEDIKKSASLQFWEHVRITHSKYQISSASWQKLKNSLPESIYQVDMTKLIKKLKQILNSKIYTFDELCDYLGRVRIYQGLDSDEAIPLINEYIKTCKSIGMEPQKFNASIKKDVDITRKLNSYVFYVRAEESALNYNPIKPYQNKKYNLKISIPNKHLEIYNAMFDVGVSTYCREITRDNLKTNHNWYVIIKEITTNKAVAILTIDKMSNDIKYILTRKGKQPKNLDNLIKESIQITK